MSAYAPSLVAAVCALILACLYTCSAQNRAVRAGSETYLYRR